MNPNTKPIYKDTPEAIKDGNAQAERAKYVLKSIPAMNEAKKSYEKNYKQMYFPVDPNNINSFILGNPIGEIVGGAPILMPEKQDLLSCKMNAAKKHAELNQINLTPSASQNSAPNYAFRIAEGDFTTSENVFLNVTVADPYPTKPNQIYSVEMVGMLMPDEGDRKITVKPSAKIANKTMAVWTNDLVRFPSVKNANLYVLNGVLQTTLNSKSTFVVWNMSPVPICIRLLFNSGANAEPISLENLKPFMPEFVKSDGSKLKHQILNSQEIVQNQTPVYFSLSDSGKCTLYTKTDDLKTANIAFENMSITKVLSYPLKENVEYVKISELGVLNQYAGNVSTPVDSKLHVGPGKNPGSKKKYTMYLDESGKINMNDGSSPVSVDTFDANDAIENPQWTTKYANKHMISINSKSGQKITRETPLISKNNKFMMIISDNPPTLDVWKSGKPNNMLYSVNPDPKTDQLFLVDTNTVSKKMYLVNKKNQKTMDLKAQHNTTSFANNYPVSQLYNETLNGNGKSCEKQAYEKNASHFYVAKKKNNEVCLIPKDSKTPYNFNSKPENSPYSNSTLKVFNNGITTGDLKKDEVGVDKYEYISHPYNKLNSDILNYSLAKSGYKPNLNMTQEIPFYSYVNKSVDKIFGNKSAPILNTQPMSFYTKSKTEKFANLQDETRRQIDNRTLPLFTSYTNLQSRVNQNVSDISGHIHSINREYALQGNTVAGSGPNGKSANEHYDFTGTTIYSLNEDRTITPALLEDEKTMLTEQNNLYMISAISVATLLVAAIVVSSRT